MISDLFVSIRGSAQYWRLSSSWMLTQTRVIVLPQANRHSGGLVRANLEGVNIWVPGKPGYDSTHKNDSTKY